MAAMIRRPLERLVMGRRDWLCWGTWAMSGHIVRGAEDRVQTERVAGRARSCILIWLDGGPSHLETFDPKPDVPAEFRGPFQAISTSIPGIAVSEHLARTAQLMHHLAIVRSVTSPWGEHGLANHYLLTGYPPTAALQYPSLGAVVGRLQGRASSLPPYIVIPESRAATGAGFLGTTYEPFVTGGDPSQAAFRVRDLDPFPEVTEERLLRRRDYLNHLDAWWARRETELQQGQVADAGWERAFQLATSPEARQAFDLTQETPATRAQYGERMVGQACLLARRLTERGVPFVTVVHSGWDTHENLALSLRDGYTGAKVGVGLIPTLDQALAALLQDLHERQLLNDTLVMVMGEFGRTPKVNARGGRDHWPRAFSVAWAGAGVPGGQVIGASDRVGESPADRPVTPADLAATLLVKFGLDPHATLITPDGRPIALNAGGEPVRELLS